MLKTTHHPEPLPAYVCLGSNDAQAETMLALARHRLGLLPDMRLQRISPIYRTEPQIYKNQSWFLNQVVELLPGGTWKAATLLNTLLEMEQALGRKRTKPTERFGPRVIDADLLLYGTERSARPKCVLPHPRMNQRAFVLVPLLDIAPDISIEGVRADILLARLDYRIENNLIFQ